MDWISSPAAGKHSKSGILIVLIVLVPLFIARSTLKYYLGDAGLPLAGLLGCAFLLYILPKMDWPTPTTTPSLSLTSTTKTKSPTSSSPSVPVPINQIRFHRTLEPRPEYIPSFRWQKSSSASSSSSSHPNSSRVATGSSVGSNGSTEAIDITGIEDVTVDVGSLNLSNVSSSSSTSVYARSSLSGAKNNSSSSSLFPFHQLLPNFPLTGRSKDDNDLSSSVSHTNIGNNTFTPNTLRHRRGANTTRGTKSSPSTDEVLRRPSTASPVNTSIHNSIDSNTPSNNPNILYTNKGRRVYQGRSAERVARIKASKNAREQQKQQKSNPGTNTNDNPSPSTPPSSSKSLTDTNNDSLPVNSLTSSSLPVRIIESGSSLPIASSEDTNYHQQRRHLQLPGATSPTHEHIEESHDSSTITAASSSINGTKLLVPLPYSTIDTWLTSLKFTHYLPLFTAQEFTSLEVLVRLAENGPEQTRKVLQEIGIEKIGHREIMMVSLIDMSRGKI